MLIVTPLQKIHIIERHVERVGFVDNPTDNDSRLHTLTIEEFRDRQQAWAAFRCPACASRRLRAGVVGAGRTAGADHHAHRAERYRRWLCRPVLRRPVLRLSTGNARRWLGPGRV